MDADIVLQGSFVKMTTSKLFQELWHKSNPIPEVVLHKDSLEKKVNFGYRGDDNQIFASSNINPDPIQKNERRVGVFQQMVASMRRTAANPMQKNKRRVGLFQLDHKAGRKDGVDIIFSSLTFLIQTATVKVDLLFGYIQLFPELELVIRDAVLRGVTIRLFTNSDETTDVAFFNSTFHFGLERLLALGVHVFVPMPKEDYRRLFSSQQKLEEQDEENNGGMEMPTFPTEMVFHMKNVVVDNRVIMIGSWNCWGTSVFFDDEFSVVAFDEDDVGVRSGNDGVGSGSVTDDLNNFMTEAIDSRRFVRIDAVPDGLAIPRLYWIAGSRTMKRLMRRGF